MLSTALPEPVSTLVTVIPVPTDPEIPVVLETAETPVVFELAERLVVDIEETVGLGDAPFVPAET
jgi:hypothetical protein